MVACTSLVLATITFTIVANRIHGSATAASNPSCRFGCIGAPNLTARDLALNNEKQKLAQEYMRVLHGQEPLSIFEDHMMSLMKQRGITYSSHLPMVLAHHGKLHPASCPTTTGNIACPVYAAQFPEMKYYYCGPAAASTILVEDSFNWGSTILTNGSDHLYYDAYVVSQPSGDATSDEDLLAESKYLQTDQNGGTNFGPMQNGLNDWVGGKGGWYNTVWQSNVPGSFENDLVTDINTGWDLAGGLNITGSGATLNGYPSGVAFQHWIPIVNYGNSGATTYYADPIYNAPGYNPPEWNVPGPDTSTSTSNMIAVLERMGYIW